MQRPLSPNAATPGQQYWYALIGTLIAAALMRIAFFTGFFGSEEVTYATVAVEIANGTWATSTYAGAVRHGVNLPTAAFVWLLGASEFSANVWSLLCSVGEVALVYVLAHRLWGLRAALLSAAVIGLLPLHVHFAGRLMADAPLAFFITLSFVLFWLAERGNSARLHFAAGLAAGLAFWMKEVTIVYCIAFAVYALVYRTLNPRWLWAALGGAVAVGANCLLFWAITGDPLHMYRVIREYAAIDPGTPGQGKHFYLWYLLLDVRHTWLMGLLAVGGMVVWARDAARARRLDRDTGYVVVWALSLLAIFSLLSKQVNYMLIFVAPLCLLAGYFLAWLPRRLMYAALGVYAAGAFVLSGLEQQAVHVFTANSKAAVIYARGQSGLPVYAMTNAYRADVYSALLDPKSGGKRYIRGSLADLDFATQAPPAESRAGLMGYAIVDLETMGWARAESIRRQKDVPACLRRVSQLKPVVGPGLGYPIAAGMLSVARMMPGPLRWRLVHRLQPLVQPGAAYVYEIPVGCARDRFPAGR